MAALFPQRLEGDQASNLANQTRNLETNIRSTDIRRNIRSGSGWNRLGTRENNKKDNI